ncbi:MAG: GNAT family protein [Deltaproteobacteria bacterium]|jgi:RimJ/RimL family protein N-acetyltransferase
MTAAPSVFFAWCLKEGAEIVIVIGERSQWGKGYGSRAIRQGIRHAFFTWPKEKVVAKIHRENDRSQKAFKRVGFEKEKRLTNEDRFVLPIESYIN